MEHSTINVKDSRLFGLLSLYNLHTGFFKRALEGIKDDSAQSRLDTKANHIAWLTGSLVQERYGLAKLFGTEMQQTHYELFSDHKGIQDNTTYPPLADFKEDWDRISPVLRDILANLTAQKLDSIFEMEEMKMPYYDLISFMMYREASVIGQIALWRRLLNYPPLKYD